MQIPSIKNAIQTLLTALQPTVATSQSPAVAGELETILSESESDSAAKIHLRHWIKNKASLSKVMKKHEMLVLFKVNKAVTHDEQNRVLEAELRQRGLPVHGENGEALKQQVAPLQTMTPAPAPPIETGGAISPAAAPVQKSNFTLSTTTDGWRRMSASDRQIFGMERGVMTRADFEKLNNASRSQFCALGGRLVDSLTAPAAVAKPDVNATVITVAQFNTLPHSERGAFFKRGGKLTQ